MITRSGEDEKLENIKGEIKKEEENEKYGDRKQENEQSGTYEESKKSDNQSFGEDDKWQEIEIHKTLPRTGNDYFIVKLFLVDFIIFIGFISCVYHRKKQTAN